MSTSGDGVGAHESRLIGPQEEALRRAADEIRDARRCWAKSASEANRIKASLSYAKAQELRRTHRLTLVVDNSHGG